MVIGLWNESGGAWRVVYCSQYVMTSDHGVSHEVSKHFSGFIAAPVAIARPPHALVEC
jgi:hypothetical protein